MGPFVQIDSLRYARPWILFCGLLLLTVVSAAQTSDQPPGQFKLAGSVVNSVSGEPIRRALVQLEGNLELSVLTDANGRFEFAGLPAMQAHVTARKPGFFADEELEDAHAEPTTILVGADTDAVTVKLTPESIISGRVEAPDGEPIEDIPIRVISSSIVDGRRHWEPRANAMTNEDGEFRVANLPPGAYYVEAGPGASFRVRRSRRLNLGEEGYATSFYPGATDPTAASPLVLSPGQQQEIDFSLKPQPVFRLSGIVRGYAAETGVELQFVDRFGEQVALPTQFDSQTGRFSTKIPAGDYVLRARSQSANQLTAADLPISVNGDLAGVQVILGPSATIPIVVQREASATPDGQVFSTHDQPVAVHLFANDSPFGAQDFWSAPDPQGRSLALRNIEPGRYSVEVTTAGMWYVQSITCGTSDLLHEQLVIPSGGQLPPIEIVLRNDGAALTGSVQQDGNPEKGIALLIPDRGSAAQARVANAGQAGSFRFDHLAPGDYRLLAFDRVKDLEYRDPEVLNAYLSRGTHVTLQANGQANASVELIKVEK
ncbi:MAG TPA: carboxypeptidase-like regulatory domain-containing protein [Terriglobales bacterium]|nr:carboxypeptidase-like regulatory domain-containing protein [Terriglobales bacterium]